MKDGKYWETNQRMLKNGRFQIYLMLIAYSIIKIGFVVLICVILLSFEEFTQFSREMTFAIAFYAAIELLYSAYRFLRYSKISKNL